jgi:ADP-ribosylglycohydrolase
MISREKIVGCLVGGALGDALGGVAERGRICLSDDTQMTLATCEAIQETKGVAPEVIASAFLRAFRRGAITGVGSSTLKALRDLSAGAHWALSGARGEMAAGNGAAMRIAPLAFVLDAQNREHRRQVRDVCRITHHSDEAYLGALAVLIGIQQGGNYASTQVFSEIATALPDSRMRDRLLEFAELSDNSSIAEIADRFGSSGYVVETVPLAIFAGMRMVKESFEAVLDGLGQDVEDADTIGSIAGQIAGARIGFSALPKDLISLPFVAEVQSIAERFAGFAGAQ